MAKFYEGTTYKIEKNYHTPGDVELIVFTVEKLYMDDDGKTERAAGPTIFHFLGDMLYINGMTDIIPGAYTKSQDRWKEITPQKARRDLIQFIFEQEFKSIKIK